MSSDPSCKPRTPLGSSYMNTTFNIPAKRRATAKKLPKSNRLTLIKPVKSISKSAVRHPNPFASRNIYYDERWVQKQENGFKKWLNFILTPGLGDEEDCNTVPGQIDVGKLWKECCSNAKIPRAPTKEVMSFRAYAAQRELNKLRRNACILWQTPEVVEVIRRIETEIEKQRLVIRNDKMITKDIGMKKKFLELLLCYNPLWLRIGFETIYGEILPFHGYDLVGLSRFIITRLLSNPDISRQYAHPRVPHLYKPGFEDALHKFILKKFFQLVFFLDQAKSYGLIRHDPCLFCKDSDIKMSKDLLLAFSRDFLRGEGNLVKHLSHLKYEVKHKQTPLEEYDFAVTNIALDIRDGVRICRVLELLCNQKLSDKLRLPALSRLQKIHNVEMIMNCLKSSSISAPTNTSARDIVDGHMEKTLGLLWHIIFGFQLENILNVEKLEKEVIHLEKSLRYRVRIDDPIAKRGFGFFIERKQCKEQNQKEFEGWIAGEKVKLLLNWARLVCAHYGIEVENLTVSFADGRALCHILHHYHPTHLPQSLIQCQTTQSKEQQSSMNESNDDSFDSMTYSLENDYKTQYKGLLLNEKKNFNIFTEKVTVLGGVPVLIEASDMINTIPDLKVTVTFLSYLAARMLDLSLEMTAARTIQLWWRNIVARKVAKKMIKKNLAAIKIQRYVKKFLQNSRMTRLRKQVAAVKVLQAWSRMIIAQKHFLHLKSSAIKIQSFFRGYLARREYRELKHRELLKEKVVVMQTVVRMFLARKRAESRMSAIICIQSWYRMILPRREFLNQKKAATTIQSTYRGFRDRKALHEMKMNQAAVKIQHCVKKFLQKSRMTRLQRQIDAATTIQAWGRMILARKQFLHWKSSIIKIQSIFKGYLARKRYHELIAVISIQTWYRMTVVRRAFWNQKRAAITIQSIYRGFRDRKALYEMKMNLAAIKIQHCVKKFLQKSRMMRLQKQIAAATTLQAWIRMILAQKQFIHWKLSAIKIQSMFRGYLARKHYHELTAVISIQTWYRMSVVRRKFMKQKMGAITIQRIYRGFRVRKAILEKKMNLAAIKIQHCVKKFLQKTRMMRLQRQIAAATTLQAWSRMILSRKLFLHWKSSTIKIQSIFRGYLARKHYHEMTAVVSIQTWYRMTVVRREFLDQKRAAITIQSIYRGLRERKALHEMKMNLAAIKIQHCVKKFLQKSRIMKLQKQIAAATTLQAWIRMIIARKRFLHCKSSAIKIQSMFRGYLARKRYHELTAIINIQSWYRMSVVRKEFLNQKKAAITIQSIYRGIRERKALHKMKLNLAAIKIQHCVKKFLQKRRMMRLQRQIAAATTIQAWSLMILSRKQFLHWKSSAIKIQSMFRGYLARKHYHELTAVISIQSWYQMTVVRREFLSQKRAAITIQSIYRGFRERKALHEMKMNLAAIKIQHCVKKFLQKTRMMRLQRQIAAATTLQAWSRMILSRKLFLHWKSSAIKIQSMFRCYLARKHYHELTAVISIQTWYRMTVVRREFLDQKRAAITIQSIYRGLRERKALHEMKMNLAAIKIQHCVKKFLQKSRMMRLQKHIDAATTIQAWGRMILARKLFLQWKSSVIKIQSFFRGYLARKHYHELTAVISIQTWYRMTVVRREFLNQKRAAITIQSIYMGFRDRKALHEMKMNLAAIKIQHCVKKFLQKSRMMRLQKQIAAATTLQAWIRMILAQKQFFHWKSSAIKIQSMFRGYLARKHYHELTAVISIQSWYRMSVVRREFLNQKKAAITVQSIYRGIRERKALHEMKMNLAAIKIQHCVKKFLQKLRMMRLQRQIAAATTIQSWIRMILARKQFLHWKSFAIRMQSMFRGYLARKRHHELTAVISIQTWYRMTVVRREFLNQKRAAITVQSIYRGIRERKALHEMKMNLAAIKIQHCVKKFLQKSRIMKLQKQIAAATTLQAWIRMIIARKRFLHCKSSAIKIQSIFRRYLAKRQYCEMKRFNLLQKKVVVMQTAIRMFLVKKRTEKSLTAVISLQSWYRMSVVRREFLNRKKAAITIQSFFRGFRVRKALHVKELQKQILPNANFCEDFGKKIEEVRVKVKEAQATATEGAKLCNRTLLALDFLYNSKDMGHLIKIVRDLDVSTRFSSKCCDQLLFEGTRGLLILMDFVQRCNRSVPHMEIISSTYNVFINLAKYSPAAEIMVTIKDVITNTILSSLAIYREKYPQIFCKGCSILWTLSHYPGMKEHLKSLTVSKRLADHQYHFQKKHNKEKEDHRRRNSSIARSTTGISSTTFVVKRKILSIEPSWNMRQCVVRSHNKPYTAILSLTGLLRDE